MCICSKEDKLNIDKNYCMSSFLTFRYIVDNYKVFDKRYPHDNISLVADNEKIPCFTAEDIDTAIKIQLDNLDLSKVGILLSGGMDSAILASYMPKGTKAYTAINDAPNAVDETKKAAIYCQIYNLDHKIVKVTWNDYQQSMDYLMEHDGCPVFANEPQVYKLAQVMKKDGIDIVIFGDNADMAFGGYNLLLSEDWTYETWKKRYTFVQPEKVISHPVSMNNEYAKYKVGKNGIDYLNFMNVIFASSSSGAYINAFKAVNINYYDPYAKLKSGVPLDLSRIRNGESKYLIRELFKMKYPMLNIPDKIAMSRSVDYWLRNWKGPKRKEFIEGCVNGMTGEQKFLVYSLERFLNLLDS